MWRAWKYADDKTNNFFETQENDYGLIVPYVETMSKATYPLTIDELEMRSAQHMS